jgi:hypothetical protein
LKLCAIVGLNDEDAEGQPPKHLVDELDGRPLRAGVEYIQREHAGAVVDRGELVEPPAASCQDAVDRRAGDGYRWNRCR